MIRKLLKIHCKWRCTMMASILCCPLFLCAQQRPLLLNPQKNVIVQRCFIQYNDTKKTECVAVGEVSGIHYVIDVANASILNTWRGAFIDVASMWTERGQLQLAEPLGKVNVHTSKPAFAILNNDTWPNGVQAGYKFKGYSLDSIGRPTFLYSFDNYSVEDAIMPEKEHRGLHRELLFKSDIVNQVPISFLLAEATKIEKLRKNIYSIDDATYYIEIDEKKWPVNITHLNDKYMLITQSNKKQQINYSIIW